MRDSHQDGEDEDRGNVKDSAFIYNGLHFPKMKLASEKPPEAVLEGVIFLGEHAFDLQWFAFP